MIWLGQNTIVNFHFTLDLFTCLSELEVDRENYLNRGLFKEDMKNGYTELSCFFLNYSLTVLLFTYLVILF